jgi:hypothetical protein
VVKFLFVEILGDSLVKGDNRFFQRLVNNYQVKLKEDIVIGSCLCGHVQFEIAVEAPKLYQCHCSLCRKQSGTSSNAATFVDKNLFSWLQGQAGITSFVRILALGRIFVQPVVVQYLTRYEVRINTGCPLAY